MNRVRLVGLVCTLASVVGYVAGVVVTYPGREASIVGVMVGVTLLAIGGDSDGEDWP